MPFCVDLNFYKRAMFIEFTSTPIHVISTLEIIKKNPDLDWRFFYWGNSTSWQLGMNSEYKNFKEEFPPPLLDALLDLGLERQNCSTSMEFNQDRVSLLFQELKKSLRSIKKVEDLQRLDNSKSQIGAALANTYATLINDKYTDLRWNRWLIKKLALSYLQVYEATARLIEAEKRNNPQNQNLVLITYNGRFLHERAVRDACEALGQELYFHETTRDKYFLRKEGFHNRVQNQLLWLNHWETTNTKIDEKKAIAKQYFEGLRSTSSPFATSDAALESLNIQKPFYVFFSSNDDETVGFWDIWKENLGNQFQAIQKLSYIFDSGKDLQLVIRIHPNTKNKPWQVRRKWKQIKGSKNVVVIKPKSAISSIALVENSLGVITFGSTIGLEAAYLRKPVCVLADCGYDLLRCVSKPESWQSVENWIFDTSSGPSDNEFYDDSLARGFFVSTAGEDFSMFSVQLVKWNSWNPTGEAVEKLFPECWQTRLHRVKRRASIQVFRFWHFFNLGSVIHRER